MEIRYISKYSSLNFDNKPRNSFEYQGCYIQKFKVGDIIRFQMLIDQRSNTYPSFPDIILTNFCTNTSIQVTNITTYNVEAYTYQCDVLVMDDNIRLEKGIYELKIRYYQNSQEQIIAASYFGIYNEGAPELTDTIRIDYTHNINEFDTIFIGEQRKLYFTIRVEGGFLGLDEIFGNSSNYFRDQYYYLKQTSSIPYNSQTLTIGDRKGVPSWMGEKINLIFSLDEVHINSVRYVRSESSAPEVNEITELYPYYVYKIVVEQYDTRYLFDINPRYDYLENAEGFSYIFSFNLG